MNKLKSKSEQDQVKAYQEMVKAISPGSEKVKSILRAFLVGGLICSFGQCILYVLTRVLMMTDDRASGLTSVILVFIGATLTGIGVYDVVGKFAGAGSIVPITGFANSIVAPAMEFKREGYVLGVGAKLFALAGPVLVYGVTSSVVVGVIYWLIATVGGR